MALSKQLSARAMPAMRSLVARWHTDSLLRNSIYIMTTTALTAGSGYIYWIIAAHMYPETQVGLASALIGTMMLAATMANLGIGPTLIQILPRQKSSESWSLALNAVFLTGILSSLLAGSIAALFLPYLSPRLAVVGHNSGFLMALIAGVPMLTLAALLDSTFTAERVAGNMLTRTGVFALMRIPLLAAPIVFGYGGAHMICLSWVLAAGISALAGASLIPRLGHSYRLVTRGIWTQMRSMFSMVAGHQLISFGALAPIYILPTIVVVRLSLEQNAYFYTTWQVGSLFFMVSPSVATSLLAEGSRVHGDILHKAKSSLLIILALMFPLMLAAVAGGSLILSMFGANYSRFGYSLLIVLVLSAVPDAITNVYVAVLRVQKRYMTAAKLNIGMGTLTVALAWVLLPRLGIAGAGWAWLIAQTAGTLVVAARFLQTVYTSHAAQWQHIVAPIEARVSAIALGFREMADDARTVVKDLRHQRSPHDRGARILVIADPCSAGEALRIVPFVAMVRRGYPQASITLVANADALKALERVNEIDRVVQSDLYRYRSYPWALVRLRQIWAWVELAWQLGAGYDLVMTFYWGGILQHLLGYVMSRGPRIGYAHYPTLFSRWLLTTNLGPFQWKEGHPPQHEALLLAAGIAPEADAQPIMSYTGDDVAAVRRMLAKHKIANSARLITLHPGSDWACQQWLRERWAELADALVERYNATIVITGVASEADYIADIQKRMKAPSISLAGATTLPQMAVLLAYSALCVCVDSAIFELTQAVGTPAVVLAGPSRPDTGVFGPFNPAIIRPMSDTLASTIMACQKAHNARLAGGCWNYACPMSGLREINVPDVLEAVDEQINRERHRPKIAHSDDTQEDIPALHPALAELFAAFIAQDIRWLTLRGEKELTSPVSDVDLLIHPQDMPRAQKVLETSRYLLFPTYGRGSHQFYIGYHPATQTGVTLDIVTELTFGRFLSLRSHAATGLLLRRERLGPIFVSPKDDRFWTLFLHCVLDKGMFAPHRAAQLRELASEARLDGPLARQVALACPSGWEPERLVELVTQGDWDRLVQLAPSLRAGWRRRELVKSWWWAISNFSLQQLEIPLSRLLRPGVSIALMGPDGAGKSTLIDGIMKSFHIPVRTVYMGLWKNKRPETGADPLLPGARIARQSLEAAGRMPDAWRRYLIAKYHQTLGRVVLFDRYVYDALITAYQSTALADSPSMLKRIYMLALGHSCPAPDLVLLLDAPGDVMYARKGEKSPEELEAERQRLLALSIHVPRAQVVDATRDEATVRADVLNRIWSEYYRRWGAK